MAQVLWSDYQARTAELLAGPAGELLAKGPASGADAAARSGRSAQGGEPLPGVLQVGEVPRARKDEDA